VAGLEGVSCLHHRDAEPDKERRRAAVPRRRPSRIWVNQRVQPFGDVWALLVDGKCRAQPAARRAFPRCPSTAATSASMCRPGWPMFGAHLGYPPILDIDDADGPADQLAPVRRLDGVLS